jgi:phosphoribosylanthranilate isomerase
MSFLVKICGLRTPETLRASIDGGADMVGFVFFAKSPRNITTDQAHALSATIAGKAEKIALFVDPDDETISTVVASLRPDWLQLHGAETPERVASIRRNFGIPILKAIGVASIDDIALAEAYGCSADRFLFDAKPPENAQLPGGNGLAFDWALLRDHQTQTGRRNWLLSGGLTPENVGAAIKLTGAPGVDVSSGVENAPGEKSAEKICAFIAAARRTQDQLGLAGGSV